MGLTQVPPVVGFDEKVEGADTLTLTSLRSPPLTDDG